MLKRKPAADIPHRLEAKQLKAARELLSVMDAVESIHTSKINSRDLDPAARGARRSFSAWLQPHVFEAHQQGGTGGEPAGRHWVERV